VAVPRRHTAGAGMRESGQAQQLSLPWEGTLDFQCPALGGHNPRGHTESWECLAHSPLMGKLGLWGWSFCGASGGHQGLAFSSAAWLVDLLCFLTL
jgi:hypothetical protein